MQLKVTDNQIKNIMKNFDTSIGLLVQQSKFNTKFKFNTKIETTKATEESYFEKVNRRHVVSNGIQESII